MRFLFKADQPLGDKSATGKFVAGKAIATPACSPCSRLCGGTCCNVRRRARLQMDFRSGI